MTMTATRPWHVLLVDDDPLVVKVYSERMRHEGWTVTVARDGYEANQECRRCRYDLILLDIRMPMQNGVEVLKEIRQRGVNDRTPVYVLTSLSESEDVDDALRLGAEGVFHKAEVRPDDLVKRLSLILYGKTLVKRSTIAAEGDSWLVDEPPAEEDVYVEPHPGMPEPSPSSAAPSARPSSAPGRPRLTALAGDPFQPPGPAPILQAPAPKHREFDVYVNPFLGDGAELFRALGLREPFQCPECGGQPCLRLAATEVEGVREFSAAFFCSRCKAPI
jgi:CheY-like chemotaxis protein